MEDVAIAIDVQNLSKTYGSPSKKASSLTDISFQIPAGSVCCLLGPNGSGKTTLLKILAGLVEPSDGSFTVLGVDPRINPFQVRASIGWMPAEERSGFYGRLTGRQNLKFFGALRDLDGKEIDRMIGNLALQLGIGDEIDEMILRTSTGAKQKLALARALLHNPSVVLLDEPFRSLDHHTVLRFRRLLKDHLTRIQKKTVLLSTHLLDEARKVADMILIVQKGRLVKRLDPRDLETELRHSTVEEYYLKTVENEGER